MKDTSKAADSEFLARMKSVSGVRRLKMASSMYDAARTFVLASLDKKIADSEKRKKLFMRFYSSDFTNEQSVKICKHFASKVNKASNASKE